MPVVLHSFSFTLFDVRFTSYPFYSYSFKADATFLRWNLNLTITAPSRILLNYISLNIVVGILWYFKSQYYYALKVCVSFTTTMFSRVDMIFFIFLFQVGVILARRNRNQLLLLTAQFRALYGNMWTNTSVSKGHTYCILALHKCLCTSRSVVLKFSRLSNVSQPSADPNSFETVINLVSKIISGRYNCTGFRFTTLNRKALYQGLMLCKSFLDERNFSVFQPQRLPLDNSTIQPFVEHYVQEYLGE